jgi:hypothetical protein
MRAAFLTCFIAISAAAQTFSFRTNDVVAFVGGADVVTAQESGHLETLLTIHHWPLKLRFRNFGWEGDTVFAQPRDLGFPPLEQHLKAAGVTVLVSEFGRAEALEGHSAIEFAGAYSNFLARFTNEALRIILVVPPVCETNSQSFPDLAKRNALLLEYRRAIRGMGHPVVDLSNLAGLTDDALQITTRGHARIAREFARQLGIEVPSESKAAFEEVRRAVVAKNRLWFNYWRPQNWAFLGGDRTSVPSSRDHQNPKVRWFPAEMEKFLPLISAQEARIDHAAETARH